ncbi:penicillin acylase family protein [Dictyobacter arantiisoli]|uniref:Peptidase S45 n=1 Tax=Dictyobacter arantiisoli TaxID=2014874 RepID=A0A5A5TCY2_9CHLR|nr:penicillin acylase family protein [Dictyobacter arantiisoli]GCF08869.1 peptidase S45 [Dictyobacter arantiisoli]
MASWWQKTRTQTANVTAFVNSSFELARRRAPASSGTQQLTGLHATVEVLTDRFGVPHIYAQNDDDLYYAQGYIHAQQRLWQMDLNRRIGSGRLSEIFGDVTLKTDRFCRRLGMHRIAAAEVSKLNPEDLRIVEAYVRGINSFIEQNSKQLPIEFTLLRYQPEAWKIADVIQWGKLQAWSLSGNWESELIRARLVAKLGVERTAQLEAGYDPQHPLIIPSGVAYQGTNLGLLEQYEQIRNLSGLGSQGGSNNWVVDGSMTQSGSPILCNDPHLEQTTPSIWFECHLISADMDVSGASFPGAPGIIIGRNKHISWGVTNAVSDIQDLYIEKFDPEQPGRYEFAGQWEEAQIFREEIIVKGQDTPCIEEVRVTRHGPIITYMPSLAQSLANAFEAGTVEQPLALRWTAFDSNTMLTAIRQLNRASNWDEFRTALHDWDAPPQNIVYADTTGNIGYIMAGAIPIREQGQALLPVPGWTGAYEWTGLIPFNELPQSYNPAEHFIVTANNRVIDDTYPYYISHEWVNGYRAQRIKDLLVSKEKLTVDDMGAIQNDQYALPAQEIVPMILKLEATTGIKRATHEILQAWDYQIKTDSIGASLYTTFLRTLERIVLDAIIGDDEELLQYYQGKSQGALGDANGYRNRDIPLLIRLLRRQDDAWFSHSALPNGPTSWKMALERAFDATIEGLRAKLGNNILRWQYGLIHTMIYRHPLGNNKALAARFNRGPFQVGGNGDTVNVSHATLNDPTNVVVVASYRQIIDMQPNGTSCAIHAPGQSGHPASKHYDDFIPLWLEGTSHPMYRDRKDIITNSEGKLILNPKIFSSFPDQKFTNP